MTDPLLQRARAEGTPLIDGETVTFVWHGPNSPQLLGDFNDWERGPKPLKLKRVGPDLWARQMEFPREAYVEYAFVRGGRRVCDPLNPRHTWNGVNADNNFFHMPDAAPTPLAKRQRAAPHGTLTRHIIKTPYLIVGGKRMVYLYQPPTKAPCPLIVVYDGPDYLRRANLVNIVENLLAQGRIRPVALAFVENGGQARFIEYACSESTVLFVEHEVLPLAQKHMRLVDLKKSPGAYGVLGASLGGLMALYTGLRRPRIFGNVLSQSGAFIARTHEQVIYNLVTEGPLRPLTIWMEVGLYDIADLLPGNRRMLELLVDKGYRVTYREYSAGHNYPAWRDEVWRGLEALFGQ